MNACERPSHNACMHSACTAGRPPGGWNVGYGWSRRLLSQRAYQMERSHTQIANGFDLIHFLIEFILFRINFLMAMCDTYLEAS